MLPLSDRHAIESGRTIARNRSGIVFLCECGYIKSPFQLRTKISHCFTGHIYASTYFLLCSMVAIRESFRLLNYVYCAFVILHLFWFPWHFCIIRSINDVDHDLRCSAFPFWRGHVHMGVSILFSMFEQYILTHYEIRSAWSTPKALYFISRYYPIFYLMCAIENISDTIKCDVLIIHMVGFYFMVRSLCSTRCTHIWFKCSQKFNGRVIQGESYRVITSTTRRFDLVLCCSCRPNKTAVLKCILLTCSTRCSAFIWYQGL